MTAEKDTFPTNPQWEHLLRGALRRCQPDVHQAMEAAGTLDGYLESMVGTAMEQEQSMLAAGMTPEAAREIALNDLLEQPDEDEEESPEA